LGSHATAVARLLLPGRLSDVLMALGATFLYAIAAIVTKKLGDMPPHLIALIHVYVLKTIAFRHG
jgi:drug/metabolite transporter (DMT)-like permease